MPQSLSNLLTHLVFSTKHRQSFITEDVRLHAYIGGTLRALESPCIAINSVGDHIHILFPTGRNIAFSKLVGKVKSSSSAWIKTQGSQFRSFAWQAGYGAFAFSPSHKPALENYVATQAQHHKKVSFQDEYRRLCKKYDLPLDERYAWD